MLGIVNGAALVLPWVMLADYVGTKYIATIGVALAPIYFLPIMVGPLLMGQLMDMGGAWAVPALTTLFAVALLVAVSRVRHIELAPETNAVQQ